MSETKDDRFQDVSEFVPNWSPRRSGSKKEGNVVALEPTPESWIIGYYIGSRELTIPPKEDVHIIHKVRVIECGNPANLGGIIVEGGTDHEFFGTSVLTNQLAENIAPGECIKIQWFGLQQPKSSNGRPYQNWKVWKDTQTTPITVQSGVVVNSPATSDKDMPAEAQTGAQPAAAAGATVAEGDDDLPF